jgi:excisionase family DNA binding protein
MTTTPLQQPFCTTRDAARMLGVSLRTAQMWAESGLLTAWKTSGGHRRITLESVRKLLDGSGLRAAEIQVDATPAEAPRILVVEDDPIFQDLYQAMLVKWSMHPQVSIAENGFDALIRIGKALPDLLISDLNMPGMDGFEMLRALQDLPETADLPIIVVTGLSEAEIAFRHGVPAPIPVLGKPIQFDRLERMAAAALQGRVPVRP